MRDMRRIWVSKFAAIFGLATIGGAVSSLGYSSPVQSHASPNRVPQSVTAIPLSIQVRCENQRIPSLAETLTLFRRLRRIHELQRPLAGNLISEALGPNLTEQFVALVNAPGNLTAHQIENFRNSIILEPGRALHARRVLNRYARGFGRAARTDYTAEALLSNHQQVFRVLYRFMRFQDCAAPDLRRLRASQTHEVQPVSGQPQIATTISRPLEPSASLDALNEPFHPDSILEAGLAE